MRNDPYEALGLTKTATDDLKKAYRKLVRTSHPDLHPDDAGAEALFKAISAAYDILKDPESNARFDAGEIDGLGAERPERRYYRDFADAADNTYQQRRGFGPDADPADNLTGTPCIVLLTSWSSTVRATPTERPYFQGFPHDGR